MDRNVAFSFLSLLGNTGIQERGFKQIGVLNTNFP